MAVMAAVTQSCRPLFSLSFSLASRKAWLFYFFLFLAAIGMSRVRVPSLHTPATHSLVATHAHQSVVLLQLFLQCSRLHLSLSVRLSVCVATLSTVNSCDDTVHITSTCRVLLILFSLLTNIIGEAALKLQYGGKNTHGQKENNEWKLKCCRIENTALRTSSTS